MLVLVGTQTEGTPSGGIYGYSIDDAGAILPLSVTEAINPTFLVSHPILPVVYAVREVRETSGVVAFRLTVNGQLEMIDSMDVPGDDPCHLDISADGGFISVACYTGGSLTTSMLAGDGRFGQIGTTLQHHGRSVDPMRQRSAHVHCSLIAGPLLYVADLGLDEVDMYPLSTQGSVDVTGRRSFRMKPGAGPRHLALTRNGRHLYVISELDNTVLAMERLTADSIVEIGRYQSLPDGYDGPSYCAHIALSDDERFVYASNRGHDSICVYERKERGELILLQHADCGGAHPRHFAIVDDTWILVANKFSNLLSVLLRDPQTGLISSGGGGANDVEVPAPTCILPVMCPAA